MSPTTPQPDSESSPATSARAQADDELRRRIVERATDLLAEHGRRALTTRAVAEAVEITPPTIFRLFGEKDGLLAAVAEEGYRRFIASKAPLRPSPDPVDDLRAGWTLAVEFGLENPELFLLIYGDPTSGARPEAARHGASGLQTRLERVAAAGRLRVAPALAAQILEASARGAVFTYLEQSERPAPANFVTAMREATLSAITSEESMLSEPALTGAARALQANLSGQTALSPSELGLLSEWLDRLAEPAGPGARAS